MDLAVFDQICYQFETIATGGVPQIKALVMATFWMLATIDACMAFLTNLDDGDHFKILIQKCLKIGFWMFLLNNWGMFCSLIKNSFIMAGSVIGSGGGMGLMQHPSVIVAKGITTLEPILKFEKNFTGMSDVLSNLPMLLAGVIAYVFGCISYVILGVQVVLTYVEFYLVCALLTVFVPFGVTKWTSFLAEKAIGGVIAYGVKLMVMSCLVAIMPDVLNSYAPLMAMNPDNALTVMVALVAVSVLLAFLAWQAPALAASVMTGGPSLTAGSAAGFGAGVALVAAGATMAAAKGVSAVAGMAGAGGSSAGKSGAATAASQVNSSSTNTSTSNNTSSSSSTTGGGGQSSPTFSNGGTSSYGGGSLSSGSSAAGGGGASNDGSSSGGGAAASGGNSAGGSAPNGNTSKTAPAGAAGYAGTAAGGSAASNTANSSEMSSGGNTGDASTAAGGSSSGSSGGSSGSSPAGSQSSSASSEQSKSPTFSEAMGKMAMARNAIPQEASPQGGMSAPIRD